MMGQDFAVCGGKLRLAEWKAALVPSSRGARRGGLDASRHDVDSQVPPAHRSRLVCLALPVVLGAGMCMALGLWVARGSAHKRMCRSARRIPRRCSSRCRGVSMRISSGRILKKLISVKVLMGDDGRSHGMGFLDFKDEATATEFLKKNEDMVLKGRPATLAYSLRKAHQGGERSRLGGAVAGSA